MALPLIGMLMSGAAKMATGMLGRGVMSNLSRLGLQGAVATSEDAGGATARKMVPIQPKGIGELTKAYVSGVATGKETASGLGDLAKAFMVGRKMEPETKEHFDPVAMMKKMGVMQLSPEQLYAEAERVDEYNKPVPKESVGGFAGATKHLSKEFAATASAVTLTTMAVDTFGDRLLLASERLAPYSSTMATIAAQQRRAQMIRNVREGAMIGGATAKLSKESIEYKSLALPYKSLMTNVLTAMTSWALNLSGDALKTLKELGFENLVMAANKYLGGKDTDETPSEAISKWFAFDRNRQGTRDKPRGTADPDLFNRRPNENAEDRI